MESKIELCYATERFKRSVWYQSNATLHPTRKSDRDGRWIRYVWQGQDVWTWQVWLLFVLHRGKKYCCLLKTDCNLNGLDCICLSKSRANRAIIWNRKISLSNITETIKKIVNLTTYFAFRSEKQSVYLKTISIFDYFHFDYYPSKYNN